MIDEDWKLLTSFFPDNWRELAATTSALKGLRKDKSEDALLRTLLIHLAGGFSLRETVVRARQAQLADLSDVALLKRLRKSREWLHQLCLALFAERGLVDLCKSEQFRCRLLDATNVREPGKTGSLWRIHYSVQIPSLCCDFFRLTGTAGEGTGESFKRFPIQAGDYLVADRGYSTAPGIDYVASRKAYVTVRLNTQSTLLYNGAGKGFPLLRHVAGVKTAGKVRWWPAYIHGEENNHIPGRICVIRKTEEAIRAAHKKLRQEASKKGHTIKKETLVYAKYVIVFTTFPEDDFSACEILEWYRIRWQIELVFKRFKQIAQLGHLPKHDDESAKAWLYGKLFVALMTEKLIDYAESFSPWGYDLGQLPAAKSLA